MAKLIRMENKKRKQTPMHTSYFTNWKEFPTHLYQPISISVHLPKYQHYQRIHELAPPRQIRHYKQNAFARAYRKHLDTKVNATRVLVQIARISGNKIPVLLANELPEQFSHRHIVREWLIEERNVIITELGGIPAVQLNLNFNLK